AALNLRVRDQVELVDHREVAEVAKTRGGLIGELGRVEHDVGLDLAPVVIDRLLAAAAHVTDRLDLAHAGSFACAFWPSRNAFSTMRRPTSPPSDISDSG